MTELQSRDMGMVVISVMLVCLIVCLESIVLYMTGNVIAQFNFILLHHGIGYIP